MSSHFTVVYDACVLYPAPLRDLLMHLALSDLYRARWSDMIHDEWIRNVRSNRPDLDPARLERTRARMNHAVRDCVVTGFEYRRYAIEANQGTTNLATFRSITKKYPNQPPEHVLRDLIASTPGSEGKWFAAAKDAGLYNAAIELSNTSPTDPRTLARAARDFAETRPEFAVASGLAALRWISRGHGYEITGTDVLDAYAAVALAASHAGIDEHRISEQISQLLETASPHNDFLRKILGQRLSH